MYVNLVKVDYPHVSSCHKVLFLSRIRELDILLGLEGARVLLIGPDLLVELGILGLDVSGSIEGLVRLEGKGIVGKIVAGDAGGLALVHMAQVEPLCDGCPHAPLEVRRGQRLMAFENAAGKDQILLLGKIVHRSTAINGAQRLQADGAVAHYLLMKLHRRSLDGILDGDLASAFYG